MIEIGEDITYTLPDFMVGEIMTKEVITIEKEATLEELIEMFKKYHFHGFPVLHKGKLVGMVTKTDMLRTFSREGVFSRRGWSKIFAAHVKDIMTHNSRTIDPEMYTTEALDIMVSQDIRLLPVIKEDKLMGILSYTDIVKHVKKVPR